MRFTLTAQQPQPVVNRARHDHATQRRQHLRVGKAECSVFILQIVAGWGRSILHMQPRVRQSLPPEEFRNYEGISCRLTTDDGR